MAVLERVPVARISAEAREVRFGPVLLTLIGAVLFAVGWVAARVCTAAWGAVAWTFAAVRVGWQEGMHRPGSPGEDGGG